VVDALPGFGQVTGMCVSQHEWYLSLRGAGFTRCEALYIITRPSVEITRLSWQAEHGDAGQEPV
jgi:hypothetical protein